MKIVCWNIKDFTVTKVNNAKTWKVIERVINTSDLLVILEAPYKIEDQKAISNAIKSKIIGRDLQIFGTQTQSVGVGESESVMFIADKKSIKMSIPEVIELNGGVRCPVLVKLEGHSHSEGEIISFNMLAWHAPPQGKDPGTYARKLLKLAEDNDVKLIMGDFNTNAPTNEEYVLASNSARPTMLNPSVITQATKLYAFRLMDSAGADSHAVEHGVVFWLGREG